LQRLRARHLARCGAARIGGSSRGASGSGRLLLSIIATIITVAILFGALFLWLMG
jgi:hypothetical protein